MRLPQYLIIALYSMSLGMNLINHGKEEIRRYNFFTSLFATVIALGILMWGGFFG